MKLIKVKQLSVEVGKCKVNSLLFKDYQLKISINKDLYAATSYKPIEGDYVNFGTRLFLRMDNPLLQQITKCSVLVSGLDDKGNKRQIGFAEMNTKQEGPQLAQLQVLQGLGGKMSVQLQFSQSVVEVKQSKSINNKLNIFKSQISQKQSSTDQKQTSKDKNHNYYDSTPLLDNQDPQTLSVSENYMLKTSNSQRMLSNKSEELETSAATARGVLKENFRHYKSEDSQTLLSLQIRIDQLQQKLNEVNNKLSECSIKLEQALQKVSQEKRRTRLMQTQKEELFQLLTLQQLRNKMAMSHIAKLNVLVQQIKRSECGQIEFIQEKDEIIMINEQLEQQLANKNVIISQLQSDLADVKYKFTQLEDKLRKMEIKPILIENHSPKKMPFAPPKELEKVKSQKKIIDNKHTPASTKKQEDSVTHSPKEQPKIQPKQVQKKKFKKESETNKMPPQRQPKEVKVPLLPQAKLKKATSTKNMKPETKSEQKKSSHIESSLPSLGVDSQVGNDPNLMLNSRAVQSPSKPPSVVKNSGQ